MNSLYTPTIGLEIHVELKTQTKMFCDCSNGPDELTPNLHTCPICLGHPGTLPTINKTAVEAVIKTGLALNCTINPRSKFDRKNYFYPDLPKAYQISQYDKPLCLGGYMVLPKSSKNIGITRIHLEEDTAKLSHAADGKHSLVDFNRAGVPLMELVTEPDFHSAQEVVEFAQELQLIVRYLGVSEADMERGNMRLEANISIAPSGATELGTKVEVKNLNSFRSLEKAIEYEIERQSSVYEKREKIAQETRGWDEEKQKTFSQRSKESAHDYRYFPEPDLPPLSFSPEYLEGLRSKLPELPGQYRKRLSEEYNVSDSVAEIFVQNRALGVFFEETISELNALGSALDGQLVCNYITSDIKGLLTQRGISLEEAHITPAGLAFIVAAIQKGEISSRVAKDVLMRVCDTGVSPEELIKKEGLAQISDEQTLRVVAEEVIDENKEVWYDYVNGKENVLQFLIGKTIARTKGAANPQVIKKIFEEKK